MQHWSIQVPYTKANTYTFFPYTETNTYTFFCPVVIGTKLYSVVVETQQQYSVVLCAVVVETQQQYSVVLCAIVVDSSSITRLSVMRFY